MDPDAAWQLITSSAPLADRAEPAAALARWLARGGFPPAGLEPVDVLARCALLLAAALEEARDLADYGPDADAEPVDEIEQAQRLEDYAAWQEAQQ